MVRPIYLPDGTDNQSVIPAFSIRQALSKDSGLAGGNINIDFTPSDLTDPDADGNTILMEAEQCYMCAISRLAQISPTQVITINVNVGFNGASFLLNPQKLMITDYTVFYPIRLHFDENSLRFRCNNMTVNDNIRISVAKVS